MGIFARGLDFDALKHDVAVCTCFPCCRLVVLKLRGRMHLPAMRARRVVAVSHVEKGMMSSNTQQCTRVLSVRCISQDSIIRCLLDKSTVTTSLQTVRTSISPLETFFTVSHSRIHLFKRRFRPSVHFIPLQQQSPSPTFPPLQVFSLHEMCKPTDILSPIYQDNSMQQVHAHTDTSWLNNR